MAFPSIIGEFYGFNHRSGIHIDMSDSFFRFLRITAFSVLFVYLSIYVNTAHAVLSDFHDESADALSHCVLSQSQAVAGFLAGGYGSAWTASPYECTHNESNKSYQCKVQAFYNGAAQSPVLCDHFQYGGSAVTRTHYYTNLTPPCPDAGAHNITVYNQSVYPNPIPTNQLACSNACQYSKSSPSAGECTYTDSNANQQIDAGETYTCPAGYTSTGSECGSGDTNANTTPPGGGGNEYNCQNTDCSSDSNPNPGDDSGGPDVPDPDDPTDPDVDDDDGNPDTPSGPDDGTGTGDITGPGGVPDGNRDIDCNPQSNSDCEHTGSATGSNQCDTQPPCNGDPVACANLYQNWAHMCFDDGDYDNPGDCQAAFSCEGDNLKCAMLKQQRSQYCTMYYGDETNDMDVFNDVNFKDYNYVQTDDAEEIDLGDLDMSGAEFGGGAGSCPSAFPFNVYGQSYEISMQPFCDVAGYIRIFVILAALLTGAYIVTGVKK